jgi:hypothetical protein
MSWPFFWWANSKVQISVTNCSCKFTDPIPLAAYSHSCYDHTVFEVIEACDPPSHTQYTEIKVIFFVPAPVRVSHDHQPMSSDSLSRKCITHLFSTETTIPPGW